MDDLGIELHCLGELLAYTLYSSFSTYSPGEKKPGKL